MPISKTEDQDTPWRDIIDMRNVLAHNYYIASPKFLNCFFNEKV